MLPRTTPNVVNGKPSMVDTPSMYNVILVPMEWLYIADTMPIPELTFTYLTGWSSEAGAYTAEECLCRHAADLHLTSQAARAGNNHVFAKLWVLLIQYKELLRVISFGQLNDITSLWEEKISEAELAGNSYMIFTHLHCAHLLIAIIYPHRYKLRCGLVVILMPELWISCVKADCSTFAPFPDQVSGMYS